MQFLSLSGGLDSAVLCASLVAEYGSEAVRPVFLQYGAKHNIWEKSSAEKVAAYFSLPLASIDLSAAFAPIASALLLHDEREIPRESYAPKNMEQTLVPGRNLIFASVIAALAESMGGGVIALATHGGDHHIYPDCRPAFNQALMRVLLASSAGKVSLSTPFHDMDKTAIIALGLRLGAPFALTRSCYADSPLSCGLCGTCRERLQAFAANGVPDPISYA